MNSSRVKFMKLCMKNEIKKKKLYVSFCDICTGVLRHNDGEIGNDCSRIIPTWNQKRTSSCLVRMTGRCALLNHYVDNIPS